MRAPNVSAYTSIADVNLPGIKYCVSSNDMEQNVQASTTTKTQPNEGLGYPSAIVAQNPSGIYATIFRIKSPGGGGSAQLLTSVCSAPRPLAGTRKWNRYSSSQVMTAPNPSISAA